MLSNGKSAVKRKKTSDDRASEIKVNKPFAWDQYRSDVAVYLAQGHTWKETSAEYDIAESTIAEWKKHPDFAAEVDRLSLMVDVASRAYRMRLAMRVIREKGFETDRDLLDWLKFAQSETDGVKLDLTKLASAIGADEAPVADSRPSGVSPAPQLEKGGG